MVEISLSIFYYQFLISIRPFSIYLLTTTLHFQNICLWLNIGGDH